ncbi:hypothetical protein RND71_001947 [Anisodus tanguticus]|uniref:Uncharacterized protein n=1 Tax=Anisodus tanguticus TaxID=243964 RepID=A0AAE1T128_9SOLA|nr:hypothetical protein RND71_001947 [Anisodus tanguticus]
MGGARQNIPVKQAVEAYSELIYVYDSTGGACQNIHVKIAVEPYSELIPHFLSRIDFWDIMSDEIPAEANDSSSSSSAKPAREMERADRSPASATLLTIRKERSESHLLDPTGLKPLPEYLTNVISKSGKVISQVDRAAGCYFTRKIAQRQQQEWNHKLLCWENFEFQRPLAPSGFLKLGFD